MNSKESTKELCRLMAEGNHALYALKLIARGRIDIGRPIAGEASRQIAREALIKLGEDW